MKNRDIFQLQCLGRQIFGREHMKSFVQIYKSVVLKQQYGYLLCDLAVNTTEELQFRTNIVDEPTCEKVYILLIFLRYRTFIMTVVRPPD